MAKVIKLLFYRHRKFAIRYLLITSILYGGVGLGKTHLINAIGLELSKKNKVMFISAERFMYQFIKSIKNEMVNFKDFFRTANVFIINDIQFIRGKEGLQEEFFHTFNSLFEKVLR